MGPAEQAQEVNDFTTEEGVPKGLVDALQGTIGDPLRVGEIFIVRGRVYEVKIAYKKQGKFILRERRNPLKSGVRHDN